MQGVSGSNPLGSIDFSRIGPAPRVHFSVHFRPTHGSVFLCASPTGTACRTWWQDTFRSAGGWQRLDIAVVFLYQHEASPAAGIPKSLQAGTLLGIISPSRTHPATIGLVIDECGSSIPLLSWQTRTATRLSPRSRPKLLAKSCVTSPLQGNSSCTKYAKSTLKLGRA
jgi:hypothetical protein